MKISRGSWIVIALLFGLMVGNWVAAIAQFKVNALFSDQWSFYAPLWAEADVWTLFTWQHGPHRQGIAFVLTATIMEASHWDARVESLWVAGCLALAAGLAVALKGRLAGSIKIADTWIILGGLSLLQYETVLLVPNASHSVFPLLLLLGAAHLMAGKPPPVGWGLAGVIGALALFTGFGIFVAVGIAVYLAVGLVGSTEGRGGRVAGLAVLGAAAVGFFWDYTFAPASDGYQFPPESVMAVGRFLGLMLASRVGLDATGPVAVGLGLGVAVAMLLILLAAARSGPSGGRGEGGRIGGLLFGVGALFMIFTALGRVHLGESGAMASRYTTLVVLLWWGLDLMMTGTASAKIAKRMTALGWVMALGPLLFLAQRPVADWWGTAGMRPGDLANLQTFEHRKLAWIAEMAEHGDWREAEQRVPGGLFPDLANLDPGAVLDQLSERDLSFFHGGVSGLEWLPWASKQDVIWWRPRTGGAARTTTEGARWWVNLPASGYVNLPLADGSREGIELRWGEGQGRLADAVEGGGVSLAGPEGWTVLALDGVDRARRPTLSAQPGFPTWSMREAEWLPDRRLTMEMGFHGWEEQGAYGWTTDALRARVVALAPSYLNVGIDSRFDPVASGPMVLRIDGRPIALPDRSGRVGLSIPMQTTRDGTVVELINPAGARSPAELGRWEDERRLAMRLFRFSVDAVAEFELPDRD